MSVLINQQFIAFGDGEHRSECVTGDVAPDSVAQGNIAAGRPRSVSQVKLVSGGLIFVMLTIAVFWYQFSQIQAGDEPPRWALLQCEYLLLMLLCLPLDTLASGLRIWLVGRVLQPGVDLWTCLKAEWANVGLSILTPSQTGGGFGQIYILNRGGASLGTALTISLLSFLGTVVGLLGIGLYSLVFSSIDLAGPFFHGAVLTLTLISALMVLGVVWPGLFRAAAALISRTLFNMRSRNSLMQHCWPPPKAQKGLPLDQMGPLAAKLVDLVYTYRNDIRRFVRCGRVAFVWVCLLSLASLFSRALMAFLCIRFLGLQVSTLGHIFELQMILIFLIYFAPTPGGSGLAEGVSLAILANLVPIGFAPYYNLLWRCSTLYLPATAGLICLLRTIAQDVRKAMLCRQPRQRSSVQNLNKIPA
jgi:uncharacterized protein (TIRG00374 family)